MTSTHPLTAAIAAARADDVDALRRLVDWPLTGAGRMVRALADVRHLDRARLLVTGLAELDGAAVRPEISDELLQDVAPRLAAATDIRRAAPAAAQAALESVRVPEPPAGISDEQRARLLELGRRAAAVQEVLLLVSAAHEEWPVAIAPDSGLLVLVLPDKRIQGSHVR
ncbi:MAG TPA: hypothetical protein VH561_20515 [Micromonosporaceae bacterium]|jgi:hypothetical protein